MDIARERLEREYDLELLATTPNVRYEVKLINTGEVVEVRSPTDMPDPGSIESILEPYIRATIITPNDYVGAVMELCQKRRGEHVGLHYLSPTRVQVQYDLPLAEIVLDSSTSSSRAARAMPPSTTSRSEPAVRPGRSTFSSPGTRWTPFR
jgi:GTP-binding protein LepA